MSAGFRIEDGVPYIGDCAFPWASKVRCENIDLPRSSYRSRGFWLNFENGWTLSIQFGGGNYCANRAAFEDVSAWLEDCPDAEIAAWCSTDHGEMVPFKESGDSVLGWQTPEQVLRWIDHFSTQPSGGAHGPH